MDVRRTYKREVGAALAEGGRSAAGRSTANPTPRTSTPGSVAAASSAKPPSRTT